MVNITFFQGSSEQIFGFSVEGHAGLEVCGKDVVCAAVSSAIYLVLNSIIDVLGLKPVVLEVSAGRILFKLSNKDASLCGDFLQGLRLHLVELSKQYPKNVSVSYKKIWGLFYVKN